MSPPCTAWWAYGEGLVIAEQIPAKLIPDAIKNTAVKITHRLPAADDPGWPAQLAQMLTAFAKSPWPRALLRRTPARSQATRKQAAGE